MTATPDENREPDLAADQQRLRRGRIPSDTFSNRLMLARSLAGHVSIREACEITGLNRGNWTGWERGLRPRDILDVCQRIAAGLDIDEEWLLFGGPLAGPHGPAVAEKVRRVPIHRTDEDSLTTPRLTVRPAGTGPKGRGDQSRPASPVGVTGRRPVRVGAAGTVSASQPMVINLG